jgi:hypothetical protein
MQHIVVGLLQSWEKVEGKTWPRLQDGRPLDVAGIEEPCNLKVRLPSGTMITFDNVRKTSIELVNNLVTAVSALPLERATSFPLAAKRLTAVLQQAGVNAPRVLGDLSKWTQLKEVKEPKSRLAASDVVEEGVVLRLELRQHSLGHAWYAVLDVALDPRRALAMRLQHKS